MMRWEAHTNFDRVGVGTSFSVLATCRSDDQPADVLTNGVELWIMRNDGPWIRTTVISASLDEVIIEMEDGSRWLMSPLRLGETDSGITTQGLHSQDWKIRSDLN
jgi:hypothetical protein